MISQEKRIKRALMSMHTQLKDIQRLMYCLEFQVKNNLYFQIQDQAGFGLTVKIVKLVQNNLE